MFRLITGVPEARKFNSPFCLMVNTEIRSMEFTWVPFCAIQWEMIFFTIMVIFNENLPHKILKPF